MHQISASNQKREVKSLKRRTANILKKIYAKQINTLQKKDSKWMLYNT
ncbi:hypothetical protein [Bacillus cereus]|nr:hypothetical protein [Bacillus cereus]WLG16085.1 hypothetical protein QM226_005555 [Bacillus cereus]